MQQTETKKISKLPPLIFVGIIALSILFDIIGEITEDAIVLILMVVLPIVFVLFLVAVSKKQPSQPHSHDRIDHRGDLVIDAETGKTQYRPVRSNHTHSQQEHWQQQLDGLLANGTIDKAEYAAMMRRHF